MSDIKGEGYGSNHNWLGRGVKVHGHGANNKFSEWECLDCKAYFRHFYDINPDIFDAIKSCNVHDKCPNKKGKYL